MTPQQWTRGHRHQPHRRLQHDPPGLGGHARPQVRPDHHHLLDQRPEGPVRARPTTPPPRPATSASPRRWRRRARATTSPSTWSAPGYIATEMVMAVPEKVLASRSSRRSRSAASASPRRSPASSSSSPPTTPASSPARPSRPTAASSSPETCSSPTPGPRTQPRAPARGFRLPGPVAPGGQPEFSAPGHEPFRASRPLISRHPFKQPSWRRRSEGVASSDHVGASAPPSPDRILGGAIPSAAVGTRECRRAGKQFSKRPSRLRPLCETRRHFSYRRRPTGAGRLSRRASSRSCRGARSALSGVPDAALPALDPGPRR